MALPALYGRGQYSRLKFVYNLPRLNTKKKKKETQKKKNEEKANHFLPWPQLTEG